MCLLLGFSAPAFAAEKPKAESGDGPIGQYIDLTPMALPVISDGMIKNIIYIRVRANLDKAVDAVKASDREPHLRDALIPAAYRTPFTRGDSFLMLDEAKLTAAITRDSSAILGPNKVPSVVVVSQDPQRVSGVAHPN